VAEIARCRFDLVGPGVSTSVELAAPFGQLEARRTDEVIDVLAEAEAAARGGRHVAGFVSYEAAPAFDAALAVRAPGSGMENVDLPLAWFGVFNERRATPALPYRSVVPIPSRPTQPEPSDSATAPGATAWSSEIGPAEHRRGVEMIRSAISAGDSYLVNFTTRFRRPWSGADDPFELYQQLVAGHSSGLHAIIETSEWAVASGSPELFFELASGRLTTRPMKGTAARGRWGVEDLRQAELLRTSEKERAENLMVVDLLRNDLGRVATSGTVSVPELWNIDRHPTVWQLTSTVTGAVEEAVGVVDAFRALFPCGSVTGAPKVATMGIIKGLERSPRGVYCGAIGIVEPESSEDGQGAGVRARFSVAIRTAAIDKTRQVAEYGSGGGITWDSSPGAEWEEVLVKTRSLTVSHGGAWSLLETMRFDPGPADGSDPGVRNLAAHLTRLRSSAHYFGLPVPTERDLEKKVGRAVNGLKVVARLRLLLHLDGTTEAEVGELHDQPSAILRLCLDDVSVDSGDLALFHKTTERQRYEQAVARHPGADDVVLVNERGEVTEATRANLCVLLGGRWCTPPIECGLLPGVERARLVALGHLHERVVTIDDLGRAEGVATISSLRGWRDARLCELRP
jgi:para-aminobenzoate synthetase/4-amino-4-deoxychorismate lyase